VFPIEEDLAQAQCKLWLNSEVAVLLVRRRTDQKPKARELVYNKLALHALVGACPQAVPPVSFLAEALCKTDSFFGFKLSNCDAKCRSVQWAMQEAIKGAMLYGYLRKLCRSSKKARNKVLRQLKRAVRPYKKPAAESGECSLSLRSLAGESSDGSSNGLSDDDISSGCDDLGSEGEEEEDGVVEADAANKNDMEKVRHVSPHVKLPGDADDVDAVAGADSEGDGGAASLQTDPPRLSWHTDRIDLLKSEGEEVLFPKDYPKVSLQISQAKQKGGGNDDKEEQGGKVKGCGKEEQGEKVKGCKAKGKGKNKGKGKGKFMWFWTGKGKSKMSGNIGKFRPGEVVVCFPVVLLCA
jgi:hypothetical protein